MKTVLLVSSFLVFLGAGLSSALAQPIESEPLAPMDIQSPRPQDEPSKPQPYYNRVVETPSSGGADDGMSGTTGGSSVYDMGITSPSAENHNTGMSSERRTDDAPLPIATPPASSTGAQEYDRTAPAAIPYGGSIGAAPPVKYSYGDKKFCTFKVSFSSRCCGIDQKTADKIKSFLDSKTPKLSYKRVDWGNEGEYDYCVDVAKHSDRASVYAGIKRLIPGGRTNADSIGDTALTGSGFETVTTMK